MARRRLWICREVDPMAAQGMPPAVPQAMPTEDEDGTDGPEDDGLQITNDTGIRGRHIRGSLLGLRALARLPALAIPRGRKCGGLAVSC